MKIKAPHKPCARCGTPDSRAKGHSYCRPCLRGMNAAARDKNRAKHGNGRYKPEPVKIDDFNPLWHAFIVTRDLSQLTQRITQ